MGGPRKTATQKDISPTPSEKILRTRPIKKKKKKKEKKNSNTNTCLSLLKCRTKSVGSTVTNLRSQRPKNHHLHFHLKPFRLYWTDYKKKKQICPPQDCDGASREKKLPNDRKNKGQTPNSIVQKKRFDGNKQSFRNTNGGKGVATTAECRSKKATNVDYPVS